MAQWYIAAKKADFDKMAEEYGIDPVIARIIRNRDITDAEAVRKYLRGGKEDLYPPEQMKDMDKAVDLLIKKTKDQAKIRIIGDYDADGVCASCILLKGLKACDAQVDAVIPHRVKDGYGLSDSLIEDARKEGVDTILTCDNGIAAMDQIALAGRLGMTVIVTDHHQIPYEEDAQGTRTYLLPPAAAIVDPGQEDCSYPCKNICGAAVAYKLMLRLFTRLHPAQEEMLSEEMLSEEMLELAAFATVCDVMELKDENRLLVKCGLRAMQHTKNPGLRALIEACGLEGKPLGAYHIGFVLGPCINSTGRLDTAGRALMLFRCEERKEAARIAMELKELNDSRKTMTVQGAEEAIELLENGGLLQDRVLVVYLKDCHESLAGIIAGRLKDRYHRPAFVLTDGEEGIKGSGRSIEGYHMYEELTACKDLFIKYGGHRMAAGLTLRSGKLSEFRKRMNDNCRLTEDDLEEKVHIDLELPFHYLSREFVDQLSILEPFGVGNPKPVFARRNVRILSGRVVGKNRNIGKFDVEDEDGTRLEMMYYGDLEAFHRFLEEKKGEKQTFSPFTITYYPSVNSFGGRETVQIVMQNYR